MSTETKTLTAEDKNKLAKRAVLHLLMRVRKEPVLAQKIGVMTETFDLLTAAAAALSDEPLEKIRNHISPGAGALPHSTVEEYLEEL